VGMGHLGEGAGGTGDALEPGNSRKVSGFVGCDGHRVITTLAGPEISLLHRNGQEGEQ
jgi:hypothetical protein